MRQMPANFPLPIGLPEDTSHVNMIIYGDTGTGKTHLLGTAFDCEETTPFLLIDFEGGTKTLHGKEVHVVRPKDWKEIQELYDYLRNENTYYKAVGVDSLTELQQAKSMGFIMGELETSGYGNLGNAIAPNRQDWLRSGEQMRKFIRAFRDLAYNPVEERRVHIFMTTLESYNEKKNCVHPQLPGALGIGCGAFVDVLCRLTKVTKMIDDEQKGQIPVTRRHLLTDEYMDEMDIRYMAKNRGNCLGKQMWEPTMEKIVGVWRDKSE